MIDNFFDKKITLDEILKGDGYGYIYDCDIDLYFGFTLPVDKRDEIKQAFYKIKI